MLLAGSPNVQVTATPTPEATSAHTFSTDEGTTEVQQAFFLAVV